MSSDCIEWGGGRISGGYGITRVDGKIKYAHRLAYEMAHGVTLSSNQHVLHACDNPPCVNPDHLSVGSHADNMADRQRKGRTARGARLPHTKLSEEQVSEIRQLKRDGMVQAHIARAYGVSAACISEIVNYRKRVS